jgi:hypothetical protein
VRLRNFRREIFRILSTGTRLHWKVRITYRCPIPSIPTKKKWNIFCAKINLRHAFPEWTFYPNYRVVNFCLRRYGGDVQDWEGSGVKSVISKAAQKYLSDGLGWEADRDQNGSQRLTNRFWRNVPPATEVASWVRPGYLLGRSFCPDGIRGFLA